MNNQKKYPILPALLSILALFCSVTVWADMYKYIDDKGNVSITDDLSKVPEKYRASAEAIKEEKVQVVAPPPTLTQPSENVAAKEISQPDNKQQSTVSNQKTTENPLKFLESSQKSLIIALAAGVVLLAAVIFILNKYVKNRMVTRVVFLLIMALVVIVLYKMYAENVYKQFSDAKKSAEAAKKLIEQQQKEQLKGLGDLGK